MVKNLRGLKSLWLNNLVLFLCCTMTTIVSTAQNCTTADALIDNVGGIWKKKVAVTVTEHEGVSHINYQVAITFNSQALIMAGKMKPNGADLRFGNCNLSVRYNYWIESGINTANTKVWVMVPSLPANGTANFFMHYDNAAGNVISASSFDNTFPPSTRLILCTSATISGANTFSWFEVKPGTTLKLDTGIISVSARKIIIDGTISGDSTGYKGGLVGQDGKGPGGGKAASQFTPGNTSGGGGGYGGNGGNGTVAFGTNGDGGLANGNITTINKGSGGGGYFGSGFNLFKGNGGGALSLKAYEIIVSGIVTLNGEEGKSVTSPGVSVGFAAGGGAGGGFLAMAYDVTIYGAVRAIGGNGGTGNGGGGGGSGGRINILCEHTYTPGTYDVSGGIAGVTTNTANLPGQNGGTGQVGQTTNYVSLEPTFVVAPEVNITITSSADSICSGSPLTFTATAGLGTYRFYKNNTAVQTSTSNTYTTSSLTNNDSIRVAAIINGCEFTTNFIKVLIIPSPNNLTASISGAACDGGDLHLLSSSTPVAASYTWSGPNSFNAVQQNPVINNITTAASGVYYVTATTSICSKTDSVTVNVGMPPTVNLGNDTIICTPLTLNAGNPGSSFLWNTTATTSAITVAVAGTYSVKVTAGNGCSVSDTIIITPGITPIVNLGNDTTICNSLPLILSAGNPGYRFLWNTNDTTQFISVASSGSYIVKVTDSIGCFGRDTIVVNALPGPHVMLGNDTALCPGISMVLNAGNPGNSYLWSTNATTQSINVNTPGIYSVKVMAGNGCYQRDTIIILQGTNPYVNLGNDTTICSNVILAVSAANSSSSGYHYLWNTNDTAQSINVHTAGTYTVRVTNSQNCVSRDTIIITTIPSPVVHLGNDTLVCPGTPVTLNAGNPGLVFNWSTGAITQMITVNTAGNYSVIVTAVNSCKASDTIHIGNLPMPSVDSISWFHITNDSVFIFVAYNPQNVLSRIWYFGDGSSDTSISPTHTFGHGGVFSVKLVLTGRCGKDTFTRNVNVLPTNISQVDNTLFRIYPNPTSDKIFIESPFKADVAVYNYLGQQVLPLSKKTDVIDVSQLADGMYYLIISKDGQLLKTNKFIKSRR